MTIHVYDMRVTIVGSGENVFSVGSIFDFELVENSFGFVKVAKLFVDVVRDLKVFDWFGRVSNVPELDRQVVSGNHQVVDHRVEGRGGNRVYNF